MHPSVVLNLYVYYRIAPEQTAAVKTCVDTLFMALANTTGIHGRWMRRLDDPGTFMEIYEAIDERERFLEHFEAALHQSGFAQFSIKRTDEWFQCA